MAQEKKCRCGNVSNQLISYFEKGTNVRITLCDNCAVNYGFKDNNKYYSAVYDKLEPEQKIHNTSAN